MSRLDNHGDFIRRRPRGPLRTPEEYRERATKFEALPVEEQERRKARDRREAELIAEVSLKASRDHYARLMSTPCGRHDAGPGETCWTVNRDGVNGFCQARISVWLTGEPLDLPDPSSNDPEFEARLQAAARSWREAQRSPEPVSTKGRKHGRGQSW